MISGYVLTDDVRRFIQPKTVICVIVGALILCLTVCLVQHDITTRIGLIVMALCVSVPIAVSAVLLSNISTLSYGCTEHTIWNQCGTTRNCVDLSHDTFITRIPITFSLKGAQWKKYYLILSNSSFSKGDISEGTLYSLSQMARKGFLILPDQADVEVWIQSQTGIYEIPDYPRTLVVPHSIQSFE